MVSGEKRNCEEENVMEKTTTILLDIEGTTTAISFVKETLFPYVRENLKSFIDTHWDDEEFKADLKALKSQANKDEEDKIENFCPIEDGEKEKETLMKNILWQMDLDRKTTALKQLQGHIWREAYENGKIKGHVYSDVAPMIKKWCEDGRKVYIYSSGSVEAQKLLFKCSESGDLTGFLSDYFDTEIGPKTEASSYTNIAKAIGCDCSQILFLTDVVKEAVAADKAGLQVTIVIRDGNTPLTDDEKKAFVTVTSFKDLVFESSNKKKKICEEDKVSQETDKTENATKMEETPTESEKMEVETTDAKTDSKEDCTEEKKTEEDGEPADNKTESENVTGSDDKKETGSDNGHVEVDASKVENGTEEKVVSSSNDVNKDETTSNGAVEQTPEEEVKKEGETTENKEENIDSTNETPATAPEDGVEKETPEENSTAEKKEEETTKETDGDEKKSQENGDGGDENGKEAVAEVNGSSGNGKVEEEISESVSLKKPAGEEQADSTVEVTA